MTMIETPQAPVPVETPPPPEAEETETLGGIQDIMAHLKKGDWAAMVGAIMSLWKEYFGTPEEKAEIARIRREKKEADTKAKTSQRLNSLRESVDTSKDASKKPDENKGSDEAIPYKPGTKEPHISQKWDLKPKIEEIYAREDTLFSIQNLDQHFGREYKRFIIESDPVTHEQPITFLGKPIRGGVNMMMLPFLKIAERKIQEQDLNYSLKANETYGFQDRNMCVGNQKGERVMSNTIPSFHKYGLAIDLDKDDNWPEKGRGTIPDEVILAMAEAGFNVGLMGDRTAYYLINDPMHFELRFPPASSAGQNIINDSPIGKRYWKAVQPLLEGIQGVA